ncbi:MAG: hypothetical protein JSS78_11810 [Bacteroidetes bacterium]|nr:hypothetical protein [Bacteroidota bacterium]
MKKILAFVFILAMYSASAQEVYTSSGKAPGVKRKELERKNKKKEIHKVDASRLVVGGTIGFGMADNVIAFNVAPMIGYRITDKLAAGFGFGYQYFRQKDALYLQDLNGHGSYFDFKANMISGSVWVRYLILQKLFAHAEYEHNFFTFDDYRYDQQGTGTIETFKQRLNVPCLLLGVGYRQPIAENASLYLMGFYDVLQRDFSPYRGGIQPRIGFTIGF